ncbi:carbohydrate binding domain-containing protein [Candidatus Parcubacteria bacterium]|nr:carbohydrate binding domain-containing protein [Candidatus Parcubacteria bacterium]
MIIDILDRYSFAKGFFLSFIIGLYLLNPQSAFWILILVPILVLFHLFFNVSRFDSNQIKRLFQILGHVILGIILNITFVFNFLTISNSFTNISYLADFKHNYLLITAINLFRLIGNNGSPQGNLGYFDFTFLNLGAFIFSILIVFYFVFKKKDSRAYFPYFLISACLLSTFFMTAIRAGFLNFLITDQNIILISARNPQKIFYFFAFAYVILIALSVDRIYTLLNRYSKWFGYALLFFLALLYLGWNSPVLVGDFSLNKTRGENNYIVGDKYQRLFKEIKTIQNGFALYLPFDYSMQIKNYWADSLVELKLGGNMTGADSANEAVSTLYRNICAGNSATPLSKILNIQYIVLDKNPNSYQKHASAGCAVESYYGTPYIWGTYDFFNGLFASNKIYYEDNNFKIYELNNLIRPEISTLDNLYSFDLSNNADTKYNFINKQLGGQFYFITSTAKNDIDPLTQIFIPFENIGLENVSINSTLVAITNIDAQKKNTLYNMGDAGGSIRINGSRVANNPKTLLSLPVGENEITYQNKAYSFSNLMTNGSFESGAWRDKVEDCHNYDKNPIIAMSLNKEEKSDGEQSLQLEATRHTACNFIKITIKGGSNYLLSFDYQSPNAKLASYYVGFNDKNKTTISANIDIKDTKWHTFSKTISAPEGATTASIYIYAKPTDNKKNIINRYDNVKLIQVPKLEDKYYLVSDPGTKLVEPKSVSFELINPTKKIVHIKGATTPFFLAMSESYHDQWQLELKNEKNTGFFGRWWPLMKPDKVGSEYHYQLNGFLNAWYVDTESLCQNNSACAKNSDGSYDIEMVIEFWPQRWFYLGLIISGITLFGCLGYLGHGFYKRRKIKKA